MSALLTEDEHDCIRLLGEAASVYAREIVGESDTREGDVAEFVSRIHDLQHAVMAQAAARAFPDQYRLAGEVVRR